MNKITPLLTGFLSLLFLLPLTVNASSASGRSSLPQIEGTQDQPKLQRVLEGNLSPGAQHKLEQWQDKWLHFQENQKTRRRMDRMLRYAIVLLIAALVLGASAGFLANVGGILGAVLSSLGALAGLGALICFILWLMDNL